MTEAPPPQRAGPPRGRGGGRSRGSWGASGPCQRLIARPGSLVLSRTTCPESASLPGGSKCWRGLPTADTHIFRAHYHFSSRQPPRRRRVLAANGRPCPLSSLPRRPVLPCVRAILSEMPPPPSVLRRLPPPESPSRGSPPASGPEAPVPSLFSSIT